MTDTPPTSRPPWDVRAANALNAGIGLVVGAALAGLGLWGVPYSLFELLRSGGADGWRDLAIAVVALGAGVRVGEFALRLWRGDGRAAPFTPPADEADEALR